MTAANQTRCLQSEEGHKFMRQWFDYYPPAVRERLRRSNFNICCACLSVKYGLNDEAVLLQGIERFEELLRPQCEAM